jgi:AsmA protein
VLTGINAPGDPQAGDDQRLFPAASAGGDGSMPYDRLDHSACFAEGSAEVTEARLVGPDETLTVTGIVPYATMRWRFRAS